MLIKRTLTSLQITQFLIGASYAMVHSFVSYTLPVGGGQTGSGGAAAAPAASPTGSLLDGLKGLVYGPGAVGHPSAPSAAATSGQQNQQQHILMPCITTTGQTFAIWLNVLYLAPLTYLFVSFFIASYIKRSSAESKKARTAGGLKGAKARRPSSHLHVAEKAGWDAATGVGREVYGDGEVVVAVSSDGKKVTSYQ